MRVLERGYQYAAVTDHSHGLKIAGGMSMAEAAEQRTSHRRRQCRVRQPFRLLQGIEANIDAARPAGSLRRRGGDLRRRTGCAAFTACGRPEDQTDRMLAAIAHPAVRILAHPRGRITGSRAGVVADWDAVFASAARRGVAIEIDGDPARQDLDHTLATRACDAGCLLALDSDAHTTAQLSYAETAIAHARLAAIPADRIVNCWPLDQLLTWLSEPASADRR